MNSTICGYHFHHFSIQDRSSITALSPYGNIKISLKIRHMATNSISRRRLVETIVMAQFVNIILKLMNYININNGTKFAFIHATYTLGTSKKTMERKNILNNTQIPSMKFSYGGC